MDVKIHVTDRQGKEQIISGVSEKEIRQSWGPKLEKFMKIREKYLIYN